MNYECAANGVFVFMFALYIGIFLGIRKGNNTKE